VIALKKHERYIYNNSKLGDGKITFTCPKCKLDILHIVGVTTYDMFFKACSDHIEKCKRGDTHGKQGKQTNEE